MIKLTFLGTSSSIPTASRNHPAILLSYANENILIDCGEGTQRQFRKAKLSTMKLTRLLITHLHGDHVLGIPGLLQTLALNNYKKTLCIYGPTGTKKFMHQLLNTFVFAGKINLNVQEVSGRFLETQDFFIEAKNMFHGPPTLAYNFVKKGQVRIDKKKLERAKLPNSPLIGRLKQGKDVIYKNKKYLAKNLVYTTQAKKISVILDTAFDSSIANFAKGADILVCASDFSHELKEKAKEYKHMTSKQCADIAKKAKVQKLVLTHLSQRYDKNPKVILDEARKEFKQSYLVNDLDVLRV